MSKLTPEQLELQETLAMSHVRAWLAGYDSAIGVVEQRLANVPLIEGDAQVTPVVKAARQLLQATIDSLRRARPANGPKGHA